MYTHCFQHDRTIRNIVHESYVYSMRQEHAHWHVRGIEGGAGTREREEWSERERDGAREREKEWMGEGGRRKEREKEMERERTRWREREMGEGERKQLLRSTNLIIHIDATHSKML